MKLPICIFDAKTGMLCANCKDKLANDEISQLDVDISSILVKQQNNKSFQKTKFYNAIDTPDMVIIVGDKSLKDALHSNSDFSKQVEKSLHKPFEVVSKEGSVKKTLSTFFSPVEVSGIDELFVPDGTKEIRINLRGNEEDLPLKADDMILISSKLTSSTIRIQFVN